MSGRRQYLLRLLVLVTTCMTTAGASAAIARFSNASAFPPSPWRVLSLGSEVGDNVIDLARKGDATVLRIQSDRAASALLHPLINQDPRSTLSWRWTVTAPLRGFDPHRRDGDDYAARLYVLFAGAESESGLLSRWRRRIAGWVTDQPIPATTLCYVWSGEEPKQSERSSGYRSPYSDTVQIIPATRGDPPPDGGWVSVSRSLLDDHLQAFGRAPGPLIGIAVAADTDDSGARVTAWIGDIELLP